MSFHETLMRFFRTNFHDEIQRLPVEGISELEEEIAARAQQQQSRSGNETDEWSGQRHGRSDSMTSANGPNGQPATAIVGQQSFFIPPLAFGQVPGAGLSPSTPTSSRRPVDTMTPLQRNLARLTRYGMSSITSGPGDRAIPNERAGAATVASEGGETSPHGSFVNVGPGTSSVSRLSVQATAKDVASTISAARSRVSRMASLNWRRNA